MFKAACCRLIFVDITKHHSYVCIYKCIRDDTKGAARQSLNCIKHKKNKIWRKTIFNIPCNVACGAGIVTVNSPRSGSTLQCDTWLWDDMPPNSPERPRLEFYIWFRFRPHHPSRHVILHQSPKFYPNRTILGRKNDVMSIFKMADLSHLGF